MESKSEQKLEASLKRVWSSTNWEACTETQSLISCKPGDLTIYLFLHSADGTTLITSQHHIWNRTFWLFFFFYSWTVVSAFLSIIKWDDTGKITKQNSNLSSALTRTNYFILKRQKSTEWNIWSKWRALLKSTLHWLHFLVTTAWKQVAR